MQAPEGRARAAAINLALPKSSGSQRVASEREAGAKNKA